MASRVSEAKESGNGAWRRTRTVGLRLTEEEYTRVEAQAARQGLSPGEWMREILLARLSAPKAELAAATATQETLLAEILALRTIVLNAVHDIGAGELTDERMAEIIQRADAGKREKARERLREPHQN